MSALQLQRPSARGIFFWYGSDHIAKAFASRRYRVGNFVERVSGASVVVGRRFPTQQLASARYVCCLRPLVDRRLSRTLASLRRAGVRLVADYDDLIFAGDVDGLPASVGGFVNERSRAARLESYAAGLASFDRITVSTRALALHVKRLSPSRPVAVIPNGLSEAWVRQGRALYPSFRPGDPLIIRYLCGSPSHDSDFAQIQAVLASFLHIHPEVELEVVGPLRFDAVAFPARRTRRLSSVPYEDLPRLLASSWVNLAPLKPTLFNECKSAIKFLEAAAFACPTLASPSDDMLRHHAQGAPLLLCRSDDDWYDQLTAMLNIERRMEAGDAAACYVGQYGMAERSVPDWLAALKHEGGPDA